MKIQEKKIRHILTIILITSTLSGFSQQLYFSRESYIRFFSNAPLEDIVAINKSSNAVLNTKNNELAVKIDMKRFEFPNKLMQEHFNENYLETNLFPYAIFKGKINKNIDWAKSQNTSVSVVGQIEIHGIQKMVILDGRLSFDPQTKSIIMDATFPIILSDFGIKIPNVVFMKIGEKVEINAQFKLYPPTNKGVEITSKSK